MFRSLGGLAKRTAAASPLAQRVRHGSGMGGGPVGYGSGVRAAPRSLHSPSSSCACPAVDVGRLARSPIRCSPLCLSLAVRHPPASFLRCSSRAPLTDRNPLMDTPPPYRSLTVGSRSPRLRSGTKIFSCFLGRRFGSGSSFGSRRTARRSSWGCTRGRRTATTMITTSMSTATSTERVCVFSILWGVAAAVDRCPRSTPSAAARAPLTAPTRVGDGVQYFESSL